MCTWPAVHLCVGLARAIYIRCTYCIFGREITKCAVKYVEYIRFWRAPPMCSVHVKMAAAHQRMSRHIRWRHYHNPIRQLWSCGTRFKFRPAAFRVSKGASKPKSTSIKRGVCISCIVFLMHPPAHTGAPPTDKAACPFITYV